MSVPLLFELPIPSWQTMFIPCAPTIVTFEGRYHCSFLKSDVGGAYLVDLENSELNHWGGEEYPGLFFLNSSFANFVECFKIFNEYGPHLRAKDVLAQYEATEHDPRLLDTMWAIMLEQDLFRQDPDTLRRT